MSTGKIFKTGRSQAVRLPKEFRFNCKEVAIRRVGSTVVLYDPKDRLIRMRDSLEKFTDDIFSSSPDGRDQVGPVERRKPL